MKLHRTLAAVLMLACGTGALAADSVSDSSAETKLFRSIYQQLIEINTSDSVGDTAEASLAMQKRLLQNGFKQDETELITPFPRKGNLIARYKGSGEKKPMLLLAHLDVVEAKRSDWNSDPFKLEEKNGHFYARGAIDDKAMAAIYVSVLGQLKREGFIPKRDIILALTADEERGSSPANGAAWLLKNRPELVAAEFGINEGGRGELKDGKPLSHVIQVGEKTFGEFLFEATGPGGHSARPTKDNTIYDLAEALVRLRQYQFPVNLNEASKFYFERNAPFQKGGTVDDMREMAKSDPDPAAVARLSAMSSMVGLLRTTCVATMLAAGHAPNALAQSAKATINCRLLPDDDFVSVSNKLAEIAGDKIKMSVIRRDESAPSSPLRNDVIGPIEAITKEMWPGVPVIPTMGVSTTDSRRFRSAGIPIYGVSGLFVDPANTGVHGLDEHIGVQQLYDGREFMYLLIKLLSN